MNHSCGSDRKGLLSLYTDPVSIEERITHPAFFQAGVELRIKREDSLCPHVCGNKWRKLKYHLFEAEETGRDTIAGFGGAYSNLLPALAAAGAKFGFRTVGIVRGEKVSNPQLDLCSVFGMELRFVSRTQYRKRYDLHQADFDLDESVYLVPEGAGGDLGVKGVAEMQFNSGYDHIFAALGSGTTLRGLLSCECKAISNSLIHGAVVLKGAEEMAGDFACHDPRRYRLYFDSHHGGYAKTDEALREFIPAFASATGIYLNWVYEAKMFFKIFSLLEEGFFKQGERILALNNSAFPDNNWMKS